MELKFVKKVDNDTFIVSKRDEETWKIENLRRQIARLQLRLDKLRAILAEAELA